MFDAPQSELTVGRSPVQIAEIVTQRCANEFGCAPCQAGLGTVDTSDLTVNFGQVGLNSVYSIADRIDLTRVPGGLRLTSNDVNPLLRTSAVTTGVNGDEFRYVVIHLTPLVQMDFTQGAGDVAVFYGSTLSGGFADTKRMNPVNSNRKFRGFNNLSAVPAGDKITLVFDAADSVDYASAWQGAIIDEFRFDISGLNDADLILHSITFCSESLFDARGSECYRTRATCDDLPNFRSIVDGHLIPTSTLRVDDELTAADFTTDGPAFFVAEVRGATTPSGTILAFGSATNFFYLGITGTDLVLCAGGDADTDDQARAVVAASAIAGRTVTLIAEVDFASDAVALWEFDPVELTLTLLASDAADVGLPAAWAASIDGQIGGDGGNTYGTEDGGDWNGAIIEVRGHDGILFEGRADESFRLRQFYGRPDMERPADDIQVEGFLRDVSTAPTMVSLAGSNTNTDAIGNRASVTISMSDQPGDDRWDDPYREDRLFNPAKTDGGYWGKWRVRQKFGRVGARTIIYEGYRGQALADMNRREYLFESLALQSRERIQIKGRDILSRAEIKKAQVPAQSPGLLAVALATTGETTITISNASLRDYPAPGTVRIDKELITYTAAAVNAGDSSLIDLTIDARGTDRSEVDSHEVDDTVQLCRRFTDRSVSSILTELLGDDALIPGQYLDIANWEAEDTSYLAAYSFSTIITEPTSVLGLAGSLVESAASFIFWDERDQLVKLRALRALTETPPVLRDGFEIIADSLSLEEKPKEQATRVQVFYNPIDFTERNGQPGDFLNGYIDADTDLEDDDGYGRKQIRTIFSPWINTNAQATQTASRLATRYSDVPVEITFALDATKRSLWIGDVFYVSHFQICRDDGRLDTSRVFLITSAEEIVPGEIMKIVAEDTTLAGFIYLIAPNSQGDYTGDGEVDGFYGFITDNNGLYSDGTQGARIS